MLAPAVRVSTLSPSSRTGVHLALRQVTWVLGACLCLPGCASILYNRGKQVQAPVGGSPAISRLEEVAQSDKPYLTVTKVTEYRTYEPVLEALFLEFTPLGVIGPLLGYPRKSIEFAGKLNLNIDPRDAESRVQDSKNCSIDGPSGSCKILLDFTKGVDDTLREKGRAIDYSPGAIEIMVSCAGVACSVTAMPDVILPDGFVRLESHEVVDQVRLREIADQEAAAKKKQKEDEERERPVRELRNARGRCLDATVYGSMYIRVLEQQSQALRDIVRARERGVEMDKNGETTSAICANLRKYMKQLDGQLGGLDKCDQVAYSMLREQDEMEMRADTERMRTRAAWSKATAIQTLRGFCGK